MPLNPQVQALLVKGFMAVSAPCQHAGGCKNLTPAIQCTSCTRTVCVKHVFLTMTVPPKPVCVSCIVDKYPELFEESP